MTPDTLPEQIAGADQLFNAGEFAECYRVAHGLLDEVAVAETPYRESWRAQLLGLIGKSALQLSLLDDALAATREALQRVHALNDGRLDPLLEGYRENLLTVLAALESPDVVDDRSQTLAHRTIRRTILRAQALTDRFRFDQSTEALGPLLDSLRPLLPATGQSLAEPDDVRVWYLPRALGLLGSNWFHRGDLPRAQALTAEALEASRALGDRTGVRVYAANLARASGGSPAEQ
jgi:tetratricopeptide (TPR) repeat protein